jgi:hypothetical protein
MSIMFNILMITHIGGKYRLVLVYFNFYILLRKVIDTVLKIVHRVKLISSASALRYLLYFTS